jgi:hypothetical protein
MKKQFTIKLTNTELIQLKTYCLTGMKMQSEDFINGMPILLKKLFDATEEQI